MSRYTTTTESDLREMLAAIGVGSIDELFDKQIPEGVRLRRALELATHREAWDVLHLGFNTDAPVTIQLDSPRMEIQLTCQDHGRPIGSGVPFAVSWPDDAPTDPAPSVRKGV